MKRLTIICGHYGAGKTNIAVNLALRGAGDGHRIAIADLDIVNPYFRSLDSREDLEAAGVRVICSEYANTNLDIPALPADLYSITDDREQQVILDIGGDDRGAYVLGRLVPEILAENDYDLWCVVNCYRPLTRDVESTMEVLHEIEAACGMKFTGIVNNSNLGAETTADTVLESLDYAAKVAQAAGIPVVMTCVDGNVTLNDEQIIKIREGGNDLLVMNLQKKVF